MSSGSQYGQTFLIENFDSTPAEPLKRVALSKAAGENVRYDEAWLQRLIMRLPTLLPVGQIENNFLGLVPICMELPVPSGSLDNLLVTPSSNIALVECKLWRNPEARREVVGQIIDYATEISRWSYDKLEEAIARTRPLDGASGGDRQSLYQRVASTSEIDEAKFVDEVSRNLRLGRFLLLIVGDGIQEGVRGMGEYLQRHAGLHFTLGLVEIAFFQLPQGGYVAQPRVFAKTVNIERGIVKIDDPRVAIIPAEREKSAVGSAPRTMSITKEQYIEKIEQGFPGISANLNLLIDKLPVYHVDPEFGTNSMILRWHPDDTRGWNLGSLPVSGQLWTDYLPGQAKAMKVVEQALQYLADIAALVPGASVKTNANGNPQVFGADGKTVKINVLLADSTQVDAWLQAISSFQAAVAQAS